MCMVCNPFCDNCRPALKKSVFCPECGKVTVFTKQTILSGGELLCKRCGEDLSNLVRPAVVRCEYSGLDCAYPCHKGINYEGGSGTCEYNTPPNVNGASLAKRALSDVEEMKFTWIR